MRVRTEAIDRFLSAVGEVILSSNQLRSAGRDLEQNAQVGAAFDRMERRVAELQRRVLDLRTTRFLRVMETLPRVARQVAEAESKLVEVELTGSELEFDRSILDRLSEPLLHVVRNAVSHGIETPQERRDAGKPEAGKLTIEARREKDSIVIDVSDDGAGVDLESVRARAVQAGLVHEDLAEDLSPDQVAEFVFWPGISTAEAVSEVSGRGVGMDAVRTSIESLGGSVELHTERGRGTRTTMQVPITAAVQRVLLVSVGGERVALPISKVERLIEVEAAAIEGTGVDAFTMIEDEPVLVLDLAERLALPSLRNPDDLVPLVLTEVRGERVALRVDQFASQREIYRKPVPSLLSELRVLAGLTLLDDGSPVFLLDLNHVA